MREIWIVARHELGCALQDRQSWVLLWVVPALVIYLVGLAASGLAEATMPIVRVDVVDHDRSTASQDIVATLGQANPALVLCPADVDPTDRCALGGQPLTHELAQQRLTTGATSAILTIPAGFAAALVEGQECVTLTFQPGSAVTGPAIALAALRRTVSQVNGPLVAARLSTQIAEAQGLEIWPGFYEARVAEARESWARPPVRVEAETTGPNEKLRLGAQVMENGFKVSLPGIASLFVMIHVLGLAQTLAEERVAGVLRRLGTMPLRKGSLLAGKLLAAVVLGLIQFAVLVAFGEWLGVGLGSGVLPALALGGAYVLAVAALGLALAAGVSTPGQAAAATTAAWVVLAPLGGGWWPLMFVPRWLQTLGHVSPVAWFMDGMNALLFRQGTWADVAQPAAVLVAFAGVLLAIGVGAFRFERQGGRGLGLRAVAFGSDRA